MHELVQEVPDIRRANKAEAAQFFQVSQPTFEKWIREGLPVLQKGQRGVSWVIDLHQAAKWKYEAKTEHGDLDPESLNPGERKLWYDGETRRRELQEKDRELIKSAEVEESTGTAFSAVAQALLALPDNLERRAGLTPEQSESCVLTIHETLNELADRLSALAPNVVES